MLNEEQENSLAKMIQKGVPLLKRPYLEIANRLNLSEQAVLDQLQGWKSDGRLREVSAILEGSYLGYDSALCCGQVSPDRIHHVAKILNQHPTITHNYLRNHYYNIWFTLATPREMSLDGTLEILAHQCELESFFALRRTHTFKIGVTFDLKTMQNTSSQELKSNHHFTCPELNDHSINILRKLQEPLPLVSSPFDELAGDDLTAEAILEFAQSHLGGAIRRYVATFRHRKMGVKSNGMIVWNIDAQEIEVKGNQLAQFPEVSHCYSRNTIPGFPYSTYSMVHGPDDETCLGIAESIAQKIGVNDYRVLFSTKEFKKVRLRYFLPELNDWWEEHLNVPSVQEST